MNTQEILEQLRKEENELNEIQHLIEVIKERKEIINNYFNTEGVTVDISKINKSTHLKKHEHNKSTNAISIIAKDDNDNIVKEFRTFAECMEYFDRSTTPVYSALKNNKAITIKGKEEIKYYLQYA